MMIINKNIDVGMMIGSFLHTYDSTPRVIMESPGRYSKNTHRCENILLR